MSKPKQYKKKGRVIQIILNKDLHKYMFSDYKQMEETGKDLVVLLNPEYPTGIKGYFLSFKRDAPEDVFPILMSSRDIKIGDVLNINCKKFKVETFCYIQQEKSGGKK